MAEPSKPSERPPPHIDSVREPLLSLAEVRRIAHLARLQPNAAQIEQYRTQLTSILQYVALLQELDVANVEPLTHPTRVATTMNRLDHDDPQPPLSFEALQRNAPAMQGRYLAVPKVLGGAAGGGDPTADDGAAEGG